MSEQEVREKETIDEKREHIPLPEVTFSTFIISLNDSALVSLGEIADPNSGKKEKNLALAQHIIDTLAMLQEKTKGNLDAEESSLLEHILFDLRLRYVKAKSS